MDAMVQNATATYNDETFTYQDICARNDGYCFENNILTLNDIMDDVSFQLYKLPFNCLMYIFFIDFRQILSGETNLTFPLMIIPTNFETILLPVFFGGTVLSKDDPSVVESVPCLQMVYFVAVDTPRQIEK